MRELADFLRPRVVKVVILKGKGAAFSEAVGSGFFVSKNGHIVTCWHCVSEYSIDAGGYLQYEYPPHIYVEWNGERHKAAIAHRTSISTPYTTDFAILKIEAGETSFLPLGTYNSVRQGDEVCFMGYPFAFPDLYFGTGHIAAMHSRQSNHNRMVRYDVMELDASVNRGNSGGPLFHVPSRTVVGIVAMRYGTISPTLEILRKYLRLWPGQGGLLETGLTELIDMGERFTNVGLGTAISVDYAKSELQAIGVPLEGSNGHSDEK